MAWIVELKQVASAVRTSHHSHNFAMYIFFITGCFNMKYCAFSEMVTCLRGHTGLVKGLTWDPVGKYIASQADDHSLKVWRTVDWQMEANITKPFNEVRSCGFKHFGLTGDLNP